MYFRTDFFKTYTLSSRSSAILRILNNRTIFPECPRILASASDSRLLNQPSSRLWDLELMVSFSPTQNITSGQTTLVCKLSSCSISDTWSFITFHCWSLFGHISNYRCNAVNVVPFFSFILSQSTKSGKNVCKNNINGFRKYSYSSISFTFCCPNLKPYLPPIYTIPYVWKDKDKFRITAIYNFTYVSASCFLWSHVRFN